MTLENITYDILIHVNHQRTAGTVDPHTLPEKEPSTARDCNHIRILTTICPKWTSYSLE